MTAAAVKGTRYRDDVQSLQENVRRLLDFAVTQALMKVDDDLIRRAVRCTSPDATITMETEAELWLCLNRLVDLIEPATPQTVKTTMDLLDSQTETMSGKIIKGATLWIFPIILLLIVVQTYTLILSNRSDELGALESQRQAFNEVYRQYHELWLTTDTGSDAERLAEQRLNEIMEDAVNHQNKIFSAVCDLTRVIPLVDDDGICAAKAQVQPHFKRPDRNMAPPPIPGVSLTAAAPRPVGPGEANAWTVADGSAADGTGGAAESTTDAAQPIVLPRTRPPTNAEALVLADRLRAATALYIEIISLYILPTLYGFIGAYVYILRHLLERLDNWSLGTSMQPKMRLRLALGSILGATVGLLFTSSEEQMTSAGFSLALFAFLAGYSAEFIFSIFDALIRRGKSAFVDDAEDGAAAKAKQAQRMATEQRAAPRPDPVPAPASTPAPEGAPDR